MQDANGSRFALLLGPHDWRRCRLDAPGAPLLATASASGALVYDPDNAAVTLAPRVSRFRAGPGDTPPDPERRLGAAIDRHGNVYSVAGGGLRIDVRSVGSGRVSVFWPPPAPAGPPATPGDFAAAEPPQPAAPRRLRALAVTTHHHLVAGLVPEAGDSGGLLVFDLLAGGPPLELRWPAPWRLEPQDMAARADGGVVVLDRVHRCVWQLDRRLGMVAAQPQVPRGADPFVADGEPPPDTTVPPAAPQPSFALALTASGGDDPVALQVLDDGAIVVLDGAGTDGFALISLYEKGALVAQASTAVAASVLPADDRDRFTLRGFDFVLHALPIVVNEVSYPQVLVVSHEGNQALAFALKRGTGSLELLPGKAFLPLRRYGGVDLVSTGRSQLSGDTGALYESQGRWLPLVAQQRRRYPAAGALVTPPLDGDDPGCTWHRLMLDGCIPPGARVHVATRAADDKAMLDDLPWHDEPRPVLRPDGSELPWLAHAPGTHTDATQGHGTWELLFQRAQGRWLQLRLGFEGNELTTPRLVALRAWKPRFSYAQRYLPAVWREDAASADFLERFLANFEGQFTTLEDRIASAAALFDVRSAPAETLDWLAGWLGLVLDPSLDDARRRQLIRHAMPLYQYRGTTAALRLAVQLVLSRCVPDADFALPAPSQRQPWGVRIVESFLTRRLPPALLGETVLADQPRAVSAGPRWALAEGAEGLQRRWAAWRARQNPGSTDTAPFSPQPPEGALRDTWAAFCEAELGAVPQLSAQVHDAWRDWRAGSGLTAPTPLPGRWPADGEPDADTQREAWRRFLATLPGPLKRWLGRWQGFLARRHLRIERYRQATGSGWPAFELVPPPLALPDNPVALADWALFETLAEPVAARAHSFSVLLPIAGPQASAGELAQQVDLARRVTELAKPAHTRFDVRPYWALFRLGQIRLGLDTLLGEGSRDAAFAPPFVLGRGHLGAARMAPRAEPPGDRLLLEC